MSFIVEIESEILHARNEREILEGPRQLFNQAAGQDGAVDKGEMARLLDTMGCEPDLIEDITKSMEQTEDRKSKEVDEFEFQSWYVLLARSRMDAWTWVELEYDFGWGLAGIDLIKRTWKRSLRRISATGSLASL